MVLEPAGAERVYVDVPGTLVFSVKAGDVVKAGDTLARLENHEMDLEIAQLQGEFDTQTLHLRNLDAEQGTDPVAAAEIPTAQKALADVKQRLSRRLRRSQRLTLVAPRAGTVLPPRGQSPDTPPGQLATWSETPLEPYNLGAYLQTGTPFCLVGDPSDLEAVAVIDQADVDFVRPGLGPSSSSTNCRTRLSSARWRPWRRSILQVAPRELADRGDLPSRVDAAGNVHPLETAYQARITLENRPQPLRSRAAGRAKIDAGSQSLGERHGDR